MQRRPNRALARWPNIFLVLAFSAGLHACAGPASTGPQTRNDWGKSNGGFRAELIITDQHEQLVQNWTDAVSRGRYPTIPKVDHVERGQSVHAVLLFSNCIRIKDGGCPMTVEFSVTKPDGTEYGSIADRTLWSGEPPARDLVYLGGPYIFFEADPIDPLGQYRITAVVRDAEGTVSVELAQSLLVDSELSPGSKVDNPTHHSQ